MKFAPEVPGQVKHSTSIEFIKLPGVKRSKSIEFI